MPLTPIGRDLAVERRPERPLTASDCDSESLLEANLVWLSNRFSNISLITLTQKQNNRELNAFEEKRSQKTFLISIRLICGKKSIDCLILFEQNRQRSQGSGVSYGCVGLTTTVLGIAAALLWHGSGLTPLQHHWHRIIRTNESIRSIHQNVCHKIERL